MTNDAQARRHRSHPVEGRRRDPSSPTREAECISAETRGARYWVKEEANTEESGEAVASIVKLGRNDPCHCGSGHKYKQCCLAKDQAAEQQALEIAIRRAEESGVTGIASAFRRAIDRVRKYNPRKIRK